MPTGDRPRSRQRRGLRRGRLFREEELRQHQAVEVRPDHLPRPRSAVGVQQREVDNLRRRPQLRHPEGARVAGSSFVPASGLLPPRGRLLKPGRRAVVDDGVHRVVENEEAKFRFPRSQSFFPRCQL